MRQGIRGFGFDSLLERVASALIVVLTKLLQTFRVKASGVAILRQGGSYRECLCRRNFAHAELLSKNCPGPADKIIHLVFIALDGSSGEDLARPRILETQINANLASAERDIRAKNNLIGIQIFANSLQRILAKAVSLRQRQTNFHPSDILSGNRAQLLSRS